MPGSVSTIFERNKSGLAYESALIEDILKKDTDGDTVLDWEESLWGLDPTKSETTPGTPDSTVVNKLRAEGSVAGASGEGGSYEENLTETDKFARELFSTVTALEQSGALDEETAERMASSLAKSIENSVQGKIYTRTDIYIVPDNITAVKTYNTGLNNIFIPSTVSYSITDVFAKFIGDGAEVNPEALKELDPIIKEFDLKTKAVLKLPTPESLVVYHINFLNALQRVSQSLSQIKLYESDSLVALGALSQYDESASSLDLAILNLQNTIAQKLK